MLILDLEDSLEPDPIWDREAIPRLPCSIRAMRGRSPHLHPVHQVTRWYEPEGVLQKLLLN